MTVAGIGHSRVRKQDKSMIRSNSAQQVLQKTDRILGQHGVRVVFRESDIPAPAYTDGKIITINTRWDPAKESIKSGFTTKSMLTVTALNYHELAHTMFMPRINSQLVIDIRNEGAFSTYNVLQDQADETKFVKLYDPAKSYFTSLVARYMLDTDEHLANNYILVSGRLFIPKRLRDLLANRFVKPKLIPDIDDLISHYKQLLYPRDQKEMYRVTVELHKLIRDIADQNSGSGTPHNEITEGQVDVRRAEEVSEIPDDYEDELEDETEERSGGSSGDDDDESVEAQDQASDEADQEEGSDTPPSDEDEESEQSPSAPGDGAGQDVLNDELEDVLEDVYQEAFEEVEQEVEDRIESVRDHESEYTVDQELGRHSKVEAEPELTQTVARCIDEFRELSGQHAPGWHMNQREGKLNHRQYARALQGNEYVYRRWREGINDALDFEVVFLLDLSYSMSGKQMTEASKSLWVLKRTFEDLNGVVTVLGFHNYLYLLSQRAQRAHVTKVPIYQTGGGTIVTPAIEEATRILSVSQKPLRLCVIVTDGDFNDTAEAMTAISRINNPVSIIGINHSVGRYSDKENVVHTQSVDNATDLVDVVKNLAIRLSDDRINRRS